MSQPKNLKELLAKRKNESAKLGNEDPQIFVQPNQVARKRLKKSRETKYRENTFLPHDLQTDTQRTQGNPVEESQKAYQDAAIVA